MDMEKILEDFRATAAGFAAAHAKQQEEIAKNGKSTDDTAASIKSFEAKITQLAADSAGIPDEIKALRENLDEMQKKLADRAGELSEENLPALTRAERFAQIGEEFWKSACDRIKADAEGTGTGRLELAVPIKGGFMGLGRGLQKALQKATFSQPELIQLQRMAGIISFTSTPTHVRDIIPVRKLGAGGIEWMQTTAFDAASASPATLSRFGAAAVVADGQTKAEAQYALELISRTARTIAHFINLTNQTLRDHAQVVRQIENDLMLGLAHREDQQLLYADGTGANVSGLTSYGIQEYAWSDGVAGDTRIEALRRAITLTWVAFHRANAVLIDPFEWESMQLTKAEADGHYLMSSLHSGGLSGTGFFMIPVIPHTAVATGTAIVGDFQTAATIWEREAAKIEAFPQNRDNPEKNLVTLRAEEAVQLQVTRPDAFVEVTFDEAPS